MLLTFLVDCNLVDVASVQEDVKNMEAGVTLLEVLKQPTVKLQNCKSEGGGRVDRP